MDTTALKKQLRKTLKARRMTLTREEVLGLSRQIFAHWQARFSLENVHYFHLFLSMEKFNEVDTSPFRYFVETQAPDTKILIPVMNTVHETLQHYELDPEIYLEKNAFGVPEPTMHSRPVSPGKIDMVMVPLLGFDERGNRLGYGKGYYDRFLAQLRPDCPKIGVAFELGKVDALPTESHDVPLDHVITEKQVYSFS